MGNARRATADLHNDPRVRAAHSLLEKSCAADSEQVNAARWWGRLETALANVLRAIEEEPPF